MEPNKNRSVSYVNGTFTFEKDFTKAQKLAAARRRLVLSMKVPFSRKRFLGYVYHYMYWVKNPKDGSIYLLHEHRSASGTYKSITKHVQAIFEQLLVEDKNNIKYQFAGIRVYSNSNIFNNHILRYQYPKHLLKCTKNLL